MDLAQEYIDYLKAVVNGEMDELDALQAWWDRHYHELRESIPIWMLVRFEQGWKLCAEATLEELGVFPNSTIGMEHDDWTSLKDPIRMLECLNRSDYPLAFRRFAVACCQRQVKWLSSEWQHGIQVATAFADNEIPMSTWEAECCELTTHFWEVRESDGGEITAAKQAVLATFDPNPFCSAVAASAAITTSVYAETSDDQEVAAEEARQADLLRQEILA